MKTCAVRFELVRPVAEKFASLCRPFMASERTGHEPIQAISELAGPVHPAIFEQPGDRNRYLGTFLDRPGTVIASDDFALGDTSGMRRDLARTVFFHEQTRAAKREQAAIEERRRAPADEHVMRGVEYPPQVVATDTGDSQALFATKRDHDAGDNDYGWSEGAFLGNFGVFWFDGRFDSEATDRSSARIWLFDRQNHSINDALLKSGNDVPDACAQFLGR